MPSSLATLGVLALGLVVSSASPLTPGSTAHGETAPARAARPAHPVRPLPVVEGLTAARRRALLTLTRAAAAEMAVGTLAGQVRRQSHPDALRLAFQAYFNFRAAHPGEVRKPYLYFVDYGLDSRTPRGYVFDMDRLQLVDGPFTVAHGRGSSARRGVPTRFSNRNGSNATSLGLFVTQEVYGFIGSAGGQQYRAPGLRLLGRSGPFNSAAWSRRVVVHGAPYVTPGRAGQSEGCPAMEMRRAQRLIPLLGNGAVVFLFSPHDRTWIGQEPWVNDRGPLSIGRG